MNELDLDILKRTAIHESGHVIVAYYYGYVVNYSCIDVANPGMGQSEILWSPDHQVINVIINPMFSAERASVLAIHRDMLSGLIGRFVTVNVAGTAAEIYLEERMNLETTVNELNAGDNDLIVDFLMDCIVLG